MQVTLEHEEIVTRVSYYVHEVYSSQVINSKRWEVMRGKLHLLYFIRNVLVVTAFLVSGRSSFMLDVGIVSGCVSNVFESIFTIEESGRFFESSLEKKL